MKTSRLLDALCNRSREALRVLEDQARFIDDDAKKTSCLKDLRHRFLKLEKAIFVRHARHRQSLKDVGRSLASPTPRKTSQDIAAASWSRLQEALRSLEETLKLDQPRLARQAEALRYETYDLQTSAPQKQWPLYALVTESLSSHSLKRLIPALIRGGVTALQLREKSLSDQQLLKRARHIKKLVGKASVDLILNDRPDLAILAGFDGVHVGQGDISPQQIKSLYGNQLIVGISTHTVNQATRATKQGCDYIGVGPIFPTQTKPHRKIIGLATAKKMIKTSSLPHVCIGGIDPSNVKDVVAIGGRGVALCTGLIQAKDPTHVGKKICRVFSKK